MSTSAQRLSLFAARPVSRSFEDLARSLNAAPFEVPGLVSASGNSGVGVVSGMTPVADLQSSTSSLGLMSEAPFDSQVYYASSPSPLPSNRTGRHLLYAPVLDSTQALLSKMGGAVADAGVVCVADLQTGGRGRGSNTWSSPPGCLMFSFQVPYPRAGGAQLPLFQYIVSIAMVRAVNAAAGIANLVRIKWPNDLYSADGKVKVGGILCQSQLDADRFVVTAGVGLNVENEEPTTCVSRLAGRRIRREALLALFFTAFDELYYGAFLAQGKPLGAAPSFSTLVDEYLANWLHDGQVLAVDGGQNVVRVEGVSPETGALLARDASDSSKRFELTPDGNRLDFLQGLVSKRI